MLESVKRSLSDGDTGPAEEHGAELVLEFPDEFRALMADHEPPPEKCEACGAPRRHRFDMDRGRWTPPAGCGNCRRLSVLAEMRNDLPAILAERGLHRRYINARLSDLPQAVRSVAGASLYLHGPVGTGKTHALAALMRSEAEAIPPAEVRYADHADYFKPDASVYPLFVSTPRFLLAVRSTFSRSGGETEEDVIRRYAEARGTLYLDDLGAEQATDWARQAIYLLLDERYAAERRTVISGNLPLDDLGARLDDRIASRIAGMCKVIELSGKDRRLVA